MGCAVAVLKEGGTDHDSVSPPPHTHTAGEAAHTHAGAQHRQDPQGRPPLPPLARTSVRPARMVGGTLRGPQPPYLPATAGPAAGGGGAAASRPRGDRASPASRREGVVGAGTSTSAPPAAKQARRGLQEGRGVRFGSLAGPADLRQHGALCPGHPRLVGGWLGGPRPVTTRVPSPGPSDWEGEGMGHPGGGRGGGY